MLGASLCDFSAMTDCENLLNNAQVWKLNNLECEIRKMNLHISVGSVLKVSYSVIVLAYLIN